MSDFKERLWRELVREHGAQLEQMRRPPPRRGPRPQLLVGSTVGLVAAGTAAALVLSAASSSPAFAVNRNHDGTVTVEILKSNGIAGANKKLIALGVRAKFVRVAVQCAQSSLQLHGVPVPAPRHWGRAQARIDPRQIPAGQTLVIASLTAGHQVVVAPAQSVRGAVPDCVPPPCAVVHRQVLAPAGAKGGNSGNSASSGHLPNRALGTVTRRSIQIPAMCGSPPLQALAPASRQQRQHRQQRQQR